MGYLFRMLHRFGLDPPFIKWVKLLYCNPKASVLTNKSVSPRFPLHWGTRQSFPLSPLIFALVLEPLAAAIRNNTNIKGIQARKMEHKLLLYADDILLLTTNPETAVPQMLSLIDTFCLISRLQNKLGGNQKQCLCLDCAYQV